MLLHIKIGLWRTGKRLYDLMKLKSIILGQMEGNGPGKSQERGSVIGTLKFGEGSLMMWGCICWQGPGYTTKIDRRMDRDLYLSILKEELQETFRYYNFRLSDIIFHRIMILSTLVKKSKHGLKTRISGP